MVESLSFLVKHHRVNLMRLAVIGATLGLLAAVGFAATKVEPLIIPIAIVAPMGVLVVLKRLELGLIAMMLSAVFVRFRIPTGTASEVVFSLVICGGILALWVVNMLVVDKRLALRPAPTNKPLLAFMVVVFVALGWSWTFRDVFVHQAGSSFVLIASAAVMALLPATFLVVANLVRDVRWLQAMVIVFLIEGLISLLITLTIDLGIGPREMLIQIIFRNQFVWVNTHGLFSMWYLTFALALALFNRQLHWAWRALLLVYAIGWVYWGFVLRLSWLSGWVPPFIAAAVIAFLRSKKLFVILVVAIILGAGGFYLRTGFEAETEESGSTRLAAYEVNWRVTSKHLLFGTGPAGYASYYMSYYPTEAMASHSNYIDLVAQTGLVGSFFYLWFFGAQVWGSYKLQRQLKERGDFATSLSAAVLAGTVGCIVAMALGDWLLPFAYTQSIAGFDSAMFNWFFMGSIWALHHSLRSQGADQPAADEGATA